MSAIFPALQACLSALSDEYSPRRLIVGLSGGVDSVVLLHALTELQNNAATPFELEAVYINHGLSANAQAWQTFCEDFCLTLGVPFTAYTVEVTPAPRESLEACARERRYQALCEHAKPLNGIILTAHHQDDQVETVLLQLKRGAGPKGLSGIPAVNTMLGCVVSRPFLAVSRRQILDYAKQYGLNWIEDESNTDVSFDRNFLRQQVLPALTERWPAFGQTVSRSASLCAEQQLLLEEVCDERLAALCETTERISVSGLSAVSVLWQKALLRRWLDNNKVAMPGAKQLEQILLMLSAKADAQPEVVLGKVVLRRYRDQLYCLKAMSGKGQIKAQTLRPGDKVYYPSFTLQWPADNTSANQAVEVLVSQQCEALSVEHAILTMPVKPRGERHHKPIRQWLKLWDIPPWERNEVLVISDAQQPVALVVKKRLISLAVEESRSVYLQIALLSEEG